MQASALPAYNPHPGFGRARESTTVALLEEHPVRDENESEGRGYFERPDTSNSVDNAVAHDEGTRGAPNAEHGNSSAQKVFLEKLELSSDAAHAEEKMQIISDMEANFEGEELLAFNVENLIEKGVLRDSQPIRTACFSHEGEYFAIGTNSQSVKICTLHNVLECLNQEGGSEGGKESTLDPLPIQVVFE